MSIVDLPKLLPTAVQLTFILLVKKKLVSCPVNSPLAALNIKTQDPKNFLRLLPQDREDTLGPEARVEEVHEAWCREP